MIGGGPTRILLVVDAPDTAKLQLGFNGVDITSESSAALYILEADKVFVTLVNGTSNALANGVGFGGMSGNSNGSIIISDGNLYINSSGDGTDANGTLEISSGYTVVVGPIQGDAATLDYDKSATITGGTFIGTGASGMAQIFRDSKQGVVAVSVGNQAAGTQIILKDKMGIPSWSIPRN